MTACTNCGAPIRAQRGGAYCMLPDCRRAFEAARSPRTRPGRITAPIPQDSAILPPLGILVADADGARVQCHACGRFYGALSGHVAVHGLTPDAYREAYGLPRGESLASPRTQERLRAHALAHDLGAQGKANLAGVPTPGRPRGSAARIGERIHHSESGRARRS